MTFAESMAWLGSLGQFGMVLGLDRIRRLAAVAGNPQSGLRFIHVAGTNGKGSTCAFLESIYRHAGFSTGLYTSPHLVSFAERIQIGRQNISKDEIARLVSELKPLADALGPDNQPTFFEFVTLMALRRFAEQKPDVVIWETGLGGRLDATNLVTPVISVITNIQFDHESWLGRTLPEIAREKAGIIKPGAPVVIGDLTHEARPVIEDVARSQNSRVISIPPALLEAKSWLAEISLPLLGRHQRVNAALAVTAVEALQPEFPVSREACVAGLRGVVWPGRLQLIRAGENRRILLDGAHNVAGIKTLCKAICENFSSEKFTLILGMLQDKDWRKMAAEIAPLAAQIIAVPVPSARSVPPAELAFYLRSQFPTLDVTATPSLANAIKSARPTSLTVVGGSLYLIGEALALFQGAVAEHGLNQWRASSPSPG